jgi:SAM-dependent methyltransferase
MNSDYLSAPTSNASVAHPEAGEDSAAVTRAMQAVYDDYFACHDYQKRYPEPNQATFGFLMRYGAGQAREILDFGCGSGRYALALLHATQANITGYDISHGALAEFRENLAQSPLAHRARALGTEPAVLEGSGCYDLVLILFGVLSHVGSRDARLTTLRQLRALMPSDGKLLLSVPSAWRRRPLELARAAYARWRGEAQGDQAEPGNILFSRTLAGAPHQFFYHLYTVQRLKDELYMAGFSVVSMDAESIMPEWLITQRPSLGWLDAKLSRFLPAFLGYGIRVVAVPSRVIT